MSYKGSQMIKTIITSKVRFKLFFPCFYQLGSDPSSSHLLDSLQHSAVAGQLFPLLLSLRLLSACRGFRHHLELRLACGGRFRMSGAGRRLIVSAVGDIKC